VLLCPQGRKGTQGVRSRVRPDFSFEIRMGGRNVNCLSISSDNLVLFDEVSRVKI